MRDRKIMISQNLNNKNENEIRNKRDLITKHFKHEGYEVADTLFINESFTKDSLIKSGVKNFDLYLLSKSLKIMSTCTHIYFCKGWSLSNRCMIEYMAAKKYGLTILYEENPLE